MAIAGSSCSARRAIARVAAARPPCRAVARSARTRGRPWRRSSSTAPARPTSASAWRTRWAARDGGGEAVALGWVEVEHEVGRPVQPVGECQRRVVLDGPLVGEPQQRAPVVAQGVGDRALGRLGPQWQALHPLRRVRREVLLHERRLAAGHPDHRQRPVAQHREDPLVHGVEVVDELALGGASALEQRLVEVGQLDAVTLGHRRSVDGLTKPELARARRPSAPAGVVLQTLGDGDLLLTGRLVGVGGELGAAVGPPRVRDGTATRRRSGCRCSIGHPTRTGRGGPTRGRSGRPQPAAWPATPAAPRGCRRRRAEDGEAAAATIVRRRAPTIVRCRRDMGPRP